MSLVGLGGGGGGLRCYSNMIITVVSDSDITTFSPVNFTIAPILLGVSVRIYNKLLISENRHTEA